MVTISQSTGCQNYPGTGLEIIQGSLLPSWPLDETPRRWNLQVRVTAIDSLTKAD